MKLDVTVEAGPFAPGGQVSGVVHVLEGGEVRELTAQLVYHEETSDYSGAVLRIGSAPLATGQLRVGETFPFALTLPADALPNQSGRHGQVIWHAIAHADIPRGNDANAGIPLGLKLPPVS